MRSFHDVNSFEKQPSPIQRRASLVQTPLGVGDQHISAAEPRGFPGVVHGISRRTTRRRSHGTDDEHGTESEMSSSFQLEPAMMKMKLKDDEQGT